MISRTAQSSIQRRHGGSAAPLRHKPNATSRLFPSSHLPTAQRYFSNRPSVINNNNNNNNVNRKIVVPIRPALNSSFSAASKTQRTPVTVVSAKLPSFFQTRHYFSRNPIGYDPDARLINSNLGKGVQDPSQGVNVSLRFLRDNPGAKKERKILGRGTGSGHGKTCGKGHKGQKARSGGSAKTTFKNNSPNLYKKVKRFGKFNKHLQTHYTALNLDKLQEFIRNGRIDTSSLITQKTLMDCGLIKRIENGVKLVGNGFADFEQKIDIQVAAVSQKAKIAIEINGGRVTKQYYNRVPLRHLVLPENFNFTTKLGVPKLSRAHRFENQSLAEAIKEYEGEEE